MKKLLSGIVVGLIIGGTSTAVALSGPHLVGDNGFLMGAEVVVYLDSGELRCYDPYVMPALKLIECYDSQFD